MPIRPSERARYPKDWKAIRARILKRAGNACECKGECGDKHSPCCSKHDGQFIGGICGARDGDHIARHLKHRARWIAFDCIGSGSCGEYDDDYEEVAHKVRITIAHLDHTPEHNDPSNLRAMCERCHLKYDAEQHAGNARRTRQARKAVGELPGIGNT